jgi:acetoin utilization deacetylase AcuC-like enzyme
VHDERYVKQIDAFTGQYQDLDPDTHLSAGSVPAAYLSAGSALQAVTAVVKGETKRAFALARPPGHHAEHDRAMGFCVFNNVAIAAEHARQELGCERVLIVDWDVHHGNGTQHLFEKRKDVLVFNAHQWPLYPDTGAVDEVGVGEGMGYTVNVPLPEGCGDGDYARVFRELLVPVAEAFRPDLVLVSAGFDAHRDDPLGGMLVTEEGFANLCAVMRGIADRCAGGRLAMILEGGYDLQGLSRSVRACTEVLSGASEPSIGLESKAGGRALKEAIDVQKTFWRL